MRLLVLAGIGLALVAGSARAAGPPVLGFSISSGAQPGLEHVSIPSAGAPNGPGSISVPVSFTSPPANPQQLSLSALHLLWQQAGAAYGIPWQVLASINKIESNFGQNMGPSSAGAVGWMQFMPSTWLRWGVDADGDGIADPWNATDAIYAAARYLAAAGGQTDISRGVFAYNHADWYVREVLDLARVYGQGGITQTADLQQVQAKLDEARGEVVRANEQLLAAEAREQELQAVAQGLHARVDGAALLSDRLAAERRAVLYDARVDAVHAATEAARAVLEQAQSALTSATQNAQAPSFAQGVGTLMGAASYHDGYVFPVGGGPQVVSVAHTHHDYPAADIAAPEGSPVYALSNAVVLNAWHAADPRCGIGMTIRTQDGLVWTYCHLAVLDPAVVTGISLAAGAQIGLVGSTGHASGPHLHLQLQPPTEFPQNQAWFQSFAGSAFTWQDAPTPLELPDATPFAARVFAVVPDSRDAAAVPDPKDAVIGFTRGGA
jgi:murein DD-endopeptidase MepM/ murein hydrolase activator NlpD